MAKLGKEKKELTTAMRIMGKKKNWKAIDECLTLRVYCGPVRGNGFALSVMTTSGKLLTSSHGTTYWDTTDSFNRMVRLKF